MLVGSLIWRPFTERFGGFIEELSELRRALLEEVILSDYTASTIDRVRAEEDRKLASKDRQLSEAERVDAVAERKIAEKERQYMAMERRENSHAREQLTALLSEIREERLLLEKDRSGKLDRASSLNIPFGDVTSFQREYWQRYRNGSTHQISSKQGKGLLILGWRVPQHGYSVNQSTRGG